MRKKSILMAALMMAAVSLTTSCNATGEEAGTIVIEGELANVPDSLVIDLYEQDGNLGSRIDTDTIIGGKFRFEVETEIEEVHSASISNYDIGLQTSDFLWIEPGAKIRIMGNGLDHSAWQIKSNVAVQKTENQFRKAAQAEWSLLHQIYMEYYPLTMRLQGGRDGKQRPSSEERKQIQVRRRELANQLDSTYKLLSAKEEALLETMTPDEAWMERLYGLSLESKLKGDTVVRARGIQFYERVDNRLRATYRGQSIANNLFPPQVVKVEDMVPEDIELKDTLGNVHRLQELRGKFLLLDFWSCGCGPCIMSFPELKELSEQMADSLEVVSISQDGEKHWKKASAKYNITWHNWNDLQKDNGIFARFGVQGIPDYFLVSPEGKVIANKGGYGKGVLKPFVLQNMEKAGKQPTYRTEGDKHIIDYPTVAEEHISTMYIRRVELTDKETAVTFRVFYPSSQWFRISDESHLITDGNEKLPIRSASNITLNKRCYTPESNVMEFTLHFPALPANAASFSYYEEENKPDDCWRMIGVRVKSAE